MGRLTGHFVLAALLVVGLAGVGHAAPILFDFDSGSPTNIGWTSASTAGGTDGTVSLAITPVGSGISIDSRERGTALTPQGVDNNNLQAPAGLVGDMYRDFIFALGSNAAGEGMDIAVSGLAPSTQYDVAVWSYDSGSPGTRSATWGQSGGSTVSLAFQGDNGSAPGPDPNTTRQTDYSASFQVMTDAAGSAVIEGRTTPGFSAVHNVFLNGIAFSEGPLPAPTFPAVQIDVDSTYGGTAIATEPGWVSLDATAGNGATASAAGVQFEVFSADGNRNRQAPNDLTADFVYDNGSGQATGLTVRNLPAGRWQAEVWAWDQAVPPGDQIVGITQFAAGSELIFTDSFTMSPTEPYTFIFDSTSLPDGFGIFTRENNSRDESRFNALRLSPAPPLTSMSIDIDVGANATEPGFTSLPVTGNAGSVIEQGVIVTVFSADDSRDRSGPNDLARDFVYDNGSGQAVGVTLDNLPAGRWKAEVWAWDSLVPLGDQIVAITQFTAGPEMVFTNSFSPSATDPFTFTFDSTNLPGGFGIFTRENNSRDEARFNALRLTALPALPFPKLIGVDIDTTQRGAPIETAAGFVSLDATAGNGAWVDANGVMFQVFSANSSVNRQAPNPLTSDFLYDDGTNAACGVQVFGLPDGIWEASVWAWDNSFPTGVGELFVGISQFTFGDEIIFTDSFMADPDNPFVFRFDSTDLPNGFGIFTRENNAANRSRFNAIQLRYIPEPATLSLLGLGLLAALRRRRK